jgi:signal transduction histidine kinase/ActR/RegA family two-component response regulator
MTIVPDATARAALASRGGYTPPDGSPAPTPDRVPDRVPDPVPDPVPGAELLALHREFEAVLDAVPSSLRVFDAAGRLTRMNTAARGEHPDGRHPTTLVALWESDAPLRVALPGTTAPGGRDVRVLFDDHPGVRALRGETIRSETYVVRRGREDGSRRVVESYARPLRDAAGQVVGAVLVDRDATERARLARALEEQVRHTMELNERVLSEAATLERMVEARSRELLALQEARSRERRLAAVGQLAAGVMHDVNNALNPIMAAAFLLERRAEEPAAVRDYAARIARAAETCAASAARVGRFIRQEPPAEGRDVAVDLSVLAEEVLAMSRAQWADGLQGRHVPMEAQLERGVTSRGLPGEIREALLNVVQNAVDAMPDGGRITVATGATDGEAWVEVRDTGMGMSEDVRDRAFEPFFTTKGSAGSGLGLAEVYGIMKRHRGRAEIRSAPGQGTAVRLAFPFVRPGRAAPPVPVLPAVPAPLRRVLLVEDNAEGREFLRALLAHDGHLVDAAGSTREARALLDVARAHDPAVADDAGAMPYDVLISDIGLPDGSGWDLVRETRQRWPRLRIVVVTGWEPPLAAEAGAADLVLRKPLRADELLHFVAHPTPLGAAPAPAAAPEPPGRPVA